jgi:hypothetical protein
VPEPQVHLGKVLDGAAPQLVEATDVRLGELVVGEIREGSATPQLEGGAQRRGADGRIATPDLVLSAEEQPLEPDGVDRVRVGMQDVARRPGGDDVREAGRLEASAQIRDVDLHRMGGGARRAVPPHKVDQPVRGDRLVRVEEQHPEKRALLRRAQVEDLPVDQHLERAEDRVVHAAPSGFRGASDAPSPEVSLVVQRTPAIVRGAREDDAPGVGTRLPRAGAPGRCGHRSRHPGA